MDNNKNENIHGWAWGGSRFDSMYQNEKEKKIPKKEKEKTGTKFTFKHGLHKDMLHHCQINITLTTHHICPWLSKLLLLCTPCPLRTTISFPCQTKNLYFPEREIN